MVTISCNAYNNNNNNNIVIIIIVVAIIIDILNMINMIVKLLIIGWVKLWVINEVDVFWYGK